jgi:hypothetical protein
LAIRSRQLAKIKGVVPLNCDDNQFAGYALGGLSDTNGQARGIPVSWNVQICVSLYETVGLANTNALPFIF